MNNSGKKLPVDRNCFLRKEKVGEQTAGIFCCYFLYLHFLMSLRGSQRSFLVLSVQ